MIAWKELTNRQGHPTDIVRVAGVLTPDECREIIERCEEHNQWSPDYGQQRKTPAEGTEQRLAEIDPEWSYSLCQKFEGVLTQLKSQFWNEMRWGIPRRIFCVRYTMDGQKSMDRHTDSSHVTFSIPLNVRSEEYGAGGVWFPRQGINLDHYLVMGDAAIWNGNSFYMPHEALLITSGKRYSLTVWFQDNNNKSTFDVEPKYLEKEE